MKLRLWPQFAAKGPAALRAETTQRADSTNRVVQYETDNYVTVPLADLVTDGDAVAFEHIETVLGHYKARSMDWLQHLLGGSTAIARIDLKEGRPNGSGFLTAANALGFADLCEEPLLVTCNHVMNDPRLPGATRRVGDALAPDRMVVRFEARPDAVRHTAEVIYQSPVGQLDVTIARLSPRPDRAMLEPWQLNVLALAGSELPEFITVAGGGRRRPRVFVLGHPQGRELSVTLEDNLFKGPVERRGSRWRFLGYTAPTEPGNSGGPVLNEALEVVGIHRAGAQAQQAGRARSSQAQLNQATSISSLLAALSAR